MNNIRTVLPKSTREAAHSPPRHRSKTSIPVSPLTTLEPAMSSSLPKSQLITSATVTPESPVIPIEKTDSPERAEKTNPKMIKQRSSSTRTIYRSAISRSIDQTDSVDLNPKATQRIFNHLFFLQKNFKNISL